MPISSNQLIGKVLKDDFNKDNGTIIKAGTILDNKHRRLFSNMGLKTITTLCDDLGEFTFRKKSQNVRI